VVQSSINRNLSAGHFIVIEELLGFVLINMTSQEDQHFKIQEKQLLYR